jgi:hypothetical protein
VKFVSGSASSRLCPNATGGMTGPQPLSVFIIHADQAGVSVRPSFPFPETGSLTIFSFPAGASVYLDGNQKGVTPLAVSGLDPGEYTLIIENDGYAPYEKKVSINTGKRTMITIALEPLFGILRVQSSPSPASVVVNGEESGMTPLAVKGLSPGDYTVTVSKTGYRTQNQTAEVRAGQEKLLYVKLSWEKKVDLKR